MAGGLLRWLCARHPVRRRRRREARLVLWGGETRAAEPGKAAGEVMMEHAAAGHVVCRADGFRIGRSAPVLAVEDRLEAGRTYLVVPVDRLPQGRGAVVTAASLAALSYGRQVSGAKSSSSSLAGGARSPFEYVKDEDGRTVIKVTEEFMVKAVTGGGTNKSRGRGGACRNNDGSNNGEDVEAGALCSTPELRKHYEQLVGAAARGRSWSPRLDTIKERKTGWRVVSPGRRSPVRLLGLGTGLS